MVPIGSESLMSFIYIAQEKSPIFALYLSSFNSFRNILCGLIFLWTTPFSLISFKPLAISIMISLKVCILYLLSFSMPPLLYKSSFKSVLQYSVSKTIFFSVSKSLIKLRVYSELHKYDISFSFCIFSIWNS